MKQFRKVWVFGLLAVVVIPLFYFFTRDSEQTYSWNTHYHWESNEPYGLSLFKELLDDAYPGKTVMMDKSLTKYQDSLNKSLNYLYAGRYYAPDSTEISELLTAVKSGMAAFLFAENFTKPLLDSLFKTHEVFYACNSLNKVVQSSEKTFVKINLVNNPLNQPLQLNYRVYDYNSPVNWRVINEEALTCQTIHEIERFGTLDSHTNAIQVQVGKGFVLLHTTPLQFTNYHLRNERDFVYAKRAMAVCLDGPLIIEPFKNLGNSPNGVTSPKPDLTQNNPIRFLFQVPALRTAWLIMILSILGYILFAVKRRQKRVEIIQRPDNYSLSFSKTVSRLFLKNQDHHKIGSLKIVHFHQFVQHRYGIAAGLKDEEFYRRVRLNSGVSEKLIQKIRGFDKLVHANSSLSSAALMELINHVNTFYATCK